jgi:hypothetical protein
MYLFRSCPLRDHLNIFRRGAATSADQTCARGIPTFCFFTKRFHSGVTVPIVFVRIIAFAEIRINHDRFAGCCFCRTDQRRDVTRRRAINADCHHLRTRFDLPHTRFKRIALTDMRFITTTETRPKVLPMPALRSGRESFHMPIALRLLRSTPACVDGESPSTRFR